MDILLKILPEAILYLASGFLFICGFYLLVDRRFDFFSEIGLVIILIIGLGITNPLRTILTNFDFLSDFTRHLIILAASLILGILIAIFRNFLGPHMRRFTFKLGRSKTSSDNFWYDIPDLKSKPVWVLLRNNKDKYILEGVLLSISEDKTNPYLLLGYYKRRDFNYNEIDYDFSKKKNYQLVVRPDSFDEILLIYDEDSSKCVDLDIRD